MALPAPRIARLFWTALQAWWNDDAPRLGASLAYSTLFASSTSSTSSTSSLDAKGVPQEQRLFVRATKVAATVSSMLAMPPARADPVVKNQDAEVDAPGITAGVRRLELPNGAIKRLAQLGEVRAPKFGRHFAGPHSASQFSTPRQRGLKEQPPSS